MSEVKKKKSRTIETVVEAFFFVLLVIIALQMNSLYTKIDNQNMIINNQQSTISQYLNLIHLNVSTTIGTQTFQLYADSSGQCTHQALFTFTAAYAGYLKISGSSSSPYTVIDVNYNTDFTSATSWFVASYMQSSINAIAPIYPSTITIYVQNCDMVPISGSITVVEYT